MAEKMSFQFRKMLQERKLQRIKSRTDIIEKELNAAQYDLEKAQLSFNRADYKWSIIQSYYSMFHASRALTYSKGYREKSHWALLVALKEFFSDSMGEERIQDFEEAMNLRESADYGPVYSNEDADHLLRKADSFIQVVRSVLKS